MDSAEVVDSVEVADNVSTSDSTAVQPDEPPADTSTAAAEPPAPTEPPEGQEESAEVAEGAVAAVAAADEETAAAEGIAGEAADSVAGEGADSVAADEAPEAEPIRLSPYEIDADEFVLEGRRYFRAKGDVVVVRDSLQAQGDSLDYDQEVGAMSIFGDARVEGQSYELTASTISVTPTSGVREELLARGDATLSGQDVDMVAPAIRMFLESGQVNRLVAIGEIPPLPGEPRTIDTQGLSAGDAARVLAIAEQAAEEADSTAAPDSLFRPFVRADQFSLTGDSIDVLSPGQVLDLVTAVGTARAEGLADDTLAASELPEVARRDWMEGDTVIADFSTGETADSAQNTQNTQNAETVEVAETADAPGATDSEQRSRLESITAVGTARSLYRMIDADTAQAEPDTLAAAPEPVRAEPADPVSELATADTVPSDSTLASGSSDIVESDEPARPALHWVEGEKIIVYLEGREVVSMDVEGQTVGYHLEPRPPGAPADSAAAIDSTAIAADSIAAGTATAPADSAAVDPDTTTARYDASPAGPETNTTGSRTSAGRAARGAGAALHRPRPRPLGPTPGDASKPERNATSDR